MGNLVKLITHCTYKKTTKMIKKPYSLDSFVIFDSMSKVNKNKGWSTTKLSVSQEWQNVYMYSVCCNSLIFKYCAAFNLSLSYFKLGRA